MGGPAAAPLSRRTWIAIAGLGATQIIGWGSTYYLLTMLGRPIGAALHLAPEFIALGMSLLLAISALLGPAVGRQMDMHGARPVMATGSLVAALGLVALSQAQGPISYLGAFAVLGLSASMTLYPAAFTALTQIAPGAARRAITLLTLPGGLASTVFWPLTSALLDHYDWRSIALIYAGLNLLLCLPLHLAVIPSGGERLRPTARNDDGPEGLPAHARRPAFWLFAAMLACNSLLITGVLNQFMSFMTGLGQSPDSAVLCGMLFGISQVSARIGDSLFGGRFAPLRVGILVNLGFPFAFLMLMGAPTLTPAGIAFAMLFGASNGLLTILRGSLVVVLFGTRGYGEQLGRVIVAQGLVGAAAPMVIAGALTRLGALPTLVLCLIIALMAVVAMAGLFRHAARLLPPAPSSR